MPDSEIPGIDSWLASIAQSLAEAQVPTGELRAEDGAYGLALELRPTREPVIDCAQMPRGATPRFDLASSHPGISRVGVVGLAAGEQIFLGRRGLKPPVSLMDVAIDMGESVQGTVIVSREGIRGKPLEVTFAAGCGGTVVAAAESEVAIHGDVPPSSSIKLNGGTLYLRDRAENLALVSLMSSSTVRADDVHPPPIEVLSIEGEGASLHLEGDASLINVIRGANDSPLMSLELTSEGDKPVVVREIHKVMLHTSGAFRVTVSDAAVDLALTGSTHINFGAGCVTKGLKCEETLQKVPQLSADRGAVVTNASGPLVLGHVPGVLIDGTSDGSLELRGAAPSVDEKGAVNWTDLTIKNFVTAGGLHGRGALAPLRPAAFVDPYTRDLPGWRSRLRIGRICREYKDDNSRLRSDLDYVRALSQLCRDVGAPGSTRTKVAWAAYRLRQRASSWPERTLLAAYRLVGYGERPLPAFALWVAAALALGLVVHARATDGWGHLALGSIHLWLEEALRQAVGPLASAFRLEVAGDDPLPPWLVLAKLVVVVPLATGLLALRSLLKEK